jgi:Tol biopolymer transport system component
MRRASASTSSGPCRLFLRGLWSLGSFTKRRLLQAALVPVLGTLIWLPGAGADGTQGHSFTFLHAGFTQELFGTQADGSDGIAFAPINGALTPQSDVLIANVRLARYDRQSTEDSGHGDVLHPLHYLAEFCGDGLWAGITNGSDGSLYANTRADAVLGVVKCDPDTGARIGGPFGPGGNGLGIALDPKTNRLVYANGCGASWVNESFTESGTFSSAEQHCGNYDGIYFDPTGDYLFASDGGNLTILARDGSFVQHVDLTVGGGADGVAFHASDPKFVVTTNNDGTMTRFDFPNGDFTQTPTQTLFASGGFRGDLSAVSPDGALYLSQSRTRFQDDEEGDPGSVVKICCGFAPSVSGKLEVKAALSPTNDPGRFNLQIDGTTQKANAGDGDTTGGIVVSTGSHTVGETGSSDPATSLADYTKSIVCKGQHGQGSIVAQGSGAGPLNVPVNQNDDIVCTITNTRVQPANPILSVEKAGAGSGTVTSTSPPGIDCGATCTHAYPAGTTVTLDASPASGSTFAGWSGGGCSGSGSCLVTLTGDTTVTATFEHVPAAAPGRIAYSLESAGTRSDIWTIDPDGTHPFNVTKNERLGAHTPAISPDGRQIAFAQDNNPAADVMGNHDVLVINADGTGLRNLTGRFHPTTVWRTWDPTWSPDGSQIAFRGGPYGFTAPEDIPDVYVVNADGTGGLTQVTHLGDVKDAAWSPVDDRIVFTRKSDRVIRTIRSDGSQLTQVYQPTCCNIGKPVWSPDGAKIAFTVSDFSIATVNVSDGSGFTILTAAGLNGSYDPSWSRDGAQIAFVRNINGFRNELFRISGTAGEAAGLTRVTTTPEPYEEQEPDWGNAAPVDSGAATQTAVSSSANPSVTGQLVTYTATATSAAGTPTGTVSFADASLPIANCQARPLADGQAYCTVTYTAPGTHSITAAYTANLGDFQPSTSSSITQTVNRAPTATSLSVSPAASSYGQQVTLTATVSASLPAFGTTTGTATFFDGGTLAGSGTLDGTGHAVFFTSMLTPGTHSLTAAFAGDGNFLGSTSAPASATVVTVAGAPASVTATAGNASANVTWNAPASDGGSPITGYAVTPYMGTVAQASISVGTATATLVSGLTNGTTYTFKIAARNAAGTGPESAASNPVTPAAPPAAATAPGAPAAPNASAGSASATVSWTAPASDGGSVITGYVVTPSVGVVAQTPTTTGNVASVTVSGLTNGTTYTFKVAARNAVGTGTQSAASNAVTPTAPLTPPTVVKPKCVVPNVVGRSLSRAKAAIKRAHCRVGKITFKASRQAKKNRVLSERPRAGKRLRNGASVNLTVGRGRR